MEKTARKNKVTLFFIFYFLPFIFYLAACDQPVGEKEGIDTKTPGTQEAADQPEYGILLSLIIPEGLVLTDESRLLITRLTGDDEENGAPVASLAGDDDESGAPVASLAGDDFEPLTIPVTGTIQARKIPLPPGWYLLDLLLVETGNKSYRMNQEVEVIAPEYGEEADASALLPFSFEPETSAFQSESEYESQTAALMFSTTTVNSAGLKITKYGGSGTALTREMSALNGAAAAYLTVKRKAAQTLTLGGAVRLADGAADGETPGITDVKRGIYKDVLIVDSSSIADSGGSMEFTITVSEPEKNSIGYTITLSIPSLVDSAVAIRIDNLDTREYGELYSYKQTYLVGEPFDPSSVTVICEYSDGTKRTETVYEVRGFDTSYAHTCQVQFWKGGQALSPSGSYEGVKDREAKTFTFPVLELKPPHLFFDYGVRISAKDEVPGRYTVTEGRTLVIAPVLWRIPEGAVFTWTVSGNGASYEANGEFLTFKPGTQAGNYNVTISASFAGQTVSASTVVECVNASSPVSQVTVITETDYMMLAPGNHLWYGGSLGSFGGYWTTKVRVDNLAGKDISVGSNAFPAWNEPGIVWVMVDENKNGYPDDTWYELRGNVDESAVTRRYAVTYYKNHAWEDNLGRWGHTLAAWPDNNSLDEMTFVGTAIDWHLLRDISGQPDGYADTMYPRCEIDNAVQVDGSPVYPPLKHIDFVKQHTGVFAYTGSFGEVSTETSAASSYHTWTNKITGAAVSGGYQYRFVNNSGYDITVTLKDSAEEIPVPDGKDVTVTLSVSSTYYRYIGGNVDCALDGNKLTFTAKTS
ncbi:MAG: bacterial Ig-like domain-containing protein [Spirochaetaceae bacterium]|jgi:hypothetical protein|nr:bacterial Ig-like domain-containing protein [Spirochaetaceae bacterium]